VLFKGQVEFFVKDENGELLSDEKIKENIKSNLEKIFRIRNVISKNRAINSCSPPAEFHDLEYPWYVNFNNIRLDISTTERGGKLFFECWRTVNDQQNECYIESFDLETGEKMVSMETPCRISSGSSQNQLPMKISNALIKNILYLLKAGLIIVLLIVLIKKRKATKL
jgi:hypothetical protein